MKARRRSRGGWRSVALAAWCLAGGPAAFAAEPGEVAYSIAGRTWTAAELRRAYEKVWRGYVVDLDSREIHPAGARGGFVVGGAIKDRASMRRVILQSGTGLVAVLCQDMVMWKPGDTLERVVVPCGTPLFAYAPPGAHPVSIPQYADATLSFDAFIRSLRAGQHYPEAPELRTKEDRAGQFRTDHVKGNSIVDP